jgi:hypothetical protein
MLGRGIIGAAIVVYLIVLGCVMLPGEAPAKKLSNESIDAKPKGATGAWLKGLPYKGAAMQIQRVDWIDKYEKSMDEIAALGFDTVSLVIDTRTEKAESQYIYLDMRMTPTPEKLSELIQHAKSKGLRVIIMPVVLLDDPGDKDWRGTLRPADWEKWFKNYREMLLHFAWIAEQNKVDVLSVGSELVSAEKERGEWTKLIRAVREVFHGQLTYSANWDHYTSIPFWDQLDLIGMNSYYKLGNDKNVSVNEIVERWREIQSDLLKFQKKIGKPLLFLEIGWCSLENAASEPWDYTRTELEADNELQKKLYEGFFRAWYRQPSLGGFIVWEWTPGDGGAAKRDGGLTEDEYNQAIKGYTPENKPAEEVLRKWLAKPWK